FLSRGQNDKIKRWQWNGFAALSRPPAVGGIRRGSRGSRALADVAGFRLRPSFSVIARRTTNNGEHPEEDEGPDRGGAVGDPKCASNGGWRQAGTAEYHLNARAGFRVVGRAALARAACQAFQ